MKLAPFLFLPLLGATGTHSAAQAPIALTAPTLSGGEFRSEVLAPNDTWFEVQTSGDLASWQSGPASQVQLSNRAPVALPVASGVTREFFRAHTPPAIRVNPAGADLKTGATQSFSAILGGAASSAVTWSVVEPGGGSITAAGLYTAPVTAGVFHVRAVSQSDPDKVLVLAVNVVAVSAVEMTRYQDAATYSKDSALGDALLVMKDGAIVFEQYVSPYATATSAHQLASGTKSFSSALFALGETMGIWSLDENVSQTITEWQGVPPKEDITIRQLISLTSGLRDSPLYDASPAVIVTLDTYDLAINGSTVEQPPGTACIYAPCNFQVLAAMFERKTGGLDPVQFLYDRLLSRLGFNPAHLALWTRDKLGKPQMAGGGYFDAHAWANYGKLWLRQGVLDGQTLLNPATMNAATTYDNAAFKGYGLTWWLNLPTGNTYNPGVDSIPADGRGDGTQISTNAPVDMFMAAGTGKQRLYIIRSLGLVIVRFGRITNAFSDHTLLGKIIGMP